MLDRVRRDLFVLAYSALLTRVHHVADQIGHTPAESKTAVSKNNKLDYY